MKNVRLIVKLRRLVKSLAVCVVMLFLFVAGSGFQNFAEGGPLKSYADSTLTDKSGFKSLFSGVYNPSQSYIAQLNPRAVPFVQSYVKSMGDELQKMKFWGKPYFDMYDDILTRYHLPIELKYLSVIESSLVPNATSVAGAVGPWQIMPDEARDMGLRVDSEKDERTNFYKSTHAAAKILKSLYKEFGDWLLVVGAYNCGVGRMRQAIRNSGSRNFWDLQNYLPAETRNHVKRFIGTHYIFEGSGGLTTMTAAEMADAKQAANPFNGDEPDVEVVAISGKYKANVICSHLGMDAALFNKLNPNFDKLITLYSYNMRLPSEKRDVFLAKRTAILNESVQQMLNI